MRLFIAGRSRLPARFERRLDIDPLSCDTHDAPTFPLGPWALAMLPHKSPSGV